MAAPTTASPETAHTAPVSTATPAPHTRSGRHLHSRGKKSDDPFLTRSLTAEVGEQFRQPSPGQPDPATPQHPDHTLLADVRHLYPIAFASPSLSLG
ncbi:MAG: hypothetical protein INR62_06980 [Rhodospirillales bacterium]|nr:hypothetical protein [Acetobacter sp.]